MITYGHLHEFRKQKRDVKRHTVNIRKARGRSFVTEFNSMYREPPSNNHRLLSGSYVWLSLSTETYGQYCRYLNDITTNHNMINPVWLGQVFRSVAASSPYTRPEFKDYIVGATPQLMFNETKTRARPTSVDTPGEQRYPCRWNWTTAYKSYTFKPGIYHEEGKKREGILFAGKVYPTGPMGTLTHMDEFVGIQLLEPKYNNADMLVEYKITLNMVIAPARSVYFNVDFRVPSRTNIYLGQGFNMKPGSGLKDDDKTYQLICKGIQIENPPSRRVTVRNIANAADKGSITHLLKDYVSEFWLRSVQKMLHIKLLWLFVETRVWQSINKNPATTKKNIEIILLNIMRKLQLAKYMTADGEFNVKKASEQIRKFIINRDTKKQKFEDFGGDSLFRELIGDIAAHGWFKNKGGSIFPFSSEFQKHMDEYDLDDLIARLKGWLAQDLGLEQAEPLFEQTKKDIGEWFDKDTKEYKNFRNRVRRTRALVEWQDIDYMWRHEQIGPCVHSRLRIPFSDHMLKFQFKRQPYTGYFGNALDQVLSNLYDETNADVFHVFVPRRREVEIHVIGGAKMQYESNMDSSTRTLGEQVAYEVLKKTITIAEGKDKPPMQVTLAPGEVVPGSGHDQRVRMFDMYNQPAEPNRTYRKYDNPWDEYKARKQQFDEKRLNCLQALFLGTNAPLKPEAEIEALKVLITKATEQKTFATTTDATSVIMEDSDGTKWLCSNQLISGWTIQDAGTMDGVVYKYWNNEFYWPNTEDNGAACSHGGFFQYAASDEGFIHITVFPSDIQKGGPQYQKLLEVYHYEKYVDNDKTIIVQPNNLYLEYVSPYEFGIIPLPTNMRVGSFFTGDGYFTAKNKLSHVVLNMDSGYYNMFDWTVPCPRFPFYITNIAKTTANNIQFLRYATISNAYFIDKIHDDENTKKRLTPYLVSDITSILKTKEKIDRANQTLTDLIAEELNNDQLVTLDLVQMTKMNIATLQSYDPANAYKLLKPSEKQVDDADDHSELIDTGKAGGRKRRGVSATDGSDSSHTKKINSATTEDDSTSTNYEKPLLLQLPTYVQDSHYIPQLYSYYWKYVLILATLSQTKEIDRSTEKAILQYLCKLNQELTGEVIAAK